MEKMVTLISPEDEVIGFEDIYQAHMHPAKLHRASSVWLVRKKEGRRQVLLQKRSQKKIVGAGQWGNGICGNVKPEESYDGCAVRRLREEIGVVGVVGVFETLPDADSVVAQLQPLYRFEYQCYSNPEFGEHELDQMYLAEYDGELHLNPEEVEDATWVDLEEFEKELEGKALIEAPNTLGRPTDQLQGITPPLMIKIDGFEYEISPWTAIMLADERLRNALRDF